LVKQFSDKISGCADFIANYVREVTVCILDNFNKTGDKLVEKLQHHPFVSHFTSTALMASGNVDGQKLLYVCVELFNIAYPIIDKQKSQK
jgi:hypothetical protein